MKQRSGEGAARMVAAIALLLITLLANGRAHAHEPSTAIAVPDATATWEMPPSMAHSARSAIGSIEIRGFGTFDYAPYEIRTRRSDVFVENAFSVFDVLVHLSEREQISMEFSYDAAQGTHVIESLNGLVGWWYAVRLGDGSLDPVTLRMDMYPVLEGMEILLFLDDPDRLDAMSVSFRQETVRSAADEPRMVIPTVEIRLPRATAVFHDVEITSRSGRTDLFQESTRTLLDVLLSLGAVGEIDALHLIGDRTRQESLGYDGLHVAWIDVPNVPGGPDPLCGVIGTVTSEVLAPFQIPHVHDGSHAHIAPDLVPLVAPEMVIWEWLCAESSS